jgi:hypothetical protein
MPDKRLVHDILSEFRNGVARRPVAFIQHGNPKDGYMYEGICPWCGEQVGFVKQETVRKTIGGLYRILLSLMKLHWTSCEAFKKVNPLAVDTYDNMAVEITKKPLNVEKLPVVQ